MRVENFTQEGHFWLENEPNEKFFGIATFENGGKVTIKIQLGFQDNEKLNKFSEQIYRQEKFNIIGFHNNQYSIFLDCFIQTVDPNFYTVLFQLNKAILDVNLNNDILKPKSIKFSFDNIYNWSKNRYSGIKRYSCENKDKLIVEYPIKKEVLLYSDNIYAVSIYFHWKTNDNSQHDFSSILVNENPLICIDIKDETSYSFEYIIEKVYQFISFILISTGNSSSIKNVEVSYDGKNYHPVYYKSLPFDCDLKEINDDKMCFGLQTILNLKENNCDIVKIWFDNFDRISNSINLYVTFNSIKGVNVENKFLWLTQALEGFNRRTVDDSEIRSFNQLKKNDKILLRHRLNYLFDILNILDEKTFNFKKIEDENITKIIADTRNDLTHSNKNFKMSKDLALDLLAFNFLLELVYLLNLFRFLGISDDKLKNYLNFYNVVYLQDLQIITIKFMNQYFERKQSIPQDIEIKPNDDEASS